MKTPRIAQDGEHTCANCGGTWPAEELKDIEDLEQRIEPGQPCPSGECPKCGCLCWPSEFPE